MKYVEVIADEGSRDTLEAIAEKARVEDLRFSTACEDGMQKTRMLVSNIRLQQLLDTLQNILGAQPTARITVLPVEMSLPKPDEEKRREEGKATAAREALYEEAARNAHLDANYLLLVVLSTTVAAIGLLEDNVAVVIGAMVIAPLLGPNLALSLGTALGDTPLVRKAAKTLAAGLLVAVLLSAMLGLFWPYALTSHELMTRAGAGLDSIALALASGAAAALSLTTGLSGVLVGVMVAVALLPPATTLGLMLGHGDTGFAAGAGLLLAVNIVCVNLASKIVFFVKRIRPRTWFEKEKARRAMVVYVIGWIVSLLVLVLFMFTRTVLPG